MRVVFIIDKKTNVLIFLGILDEGYKINQQELAKVLGVIVSKAKTFDQNSNSFAKAEISNKHYFFGNFEKLLIIIHHAPDKTPTQATLIDLNNKFIRNTSLYKIK